MLFFSLEGAFSLEKWKSKWRPSETCAFQKSWKMWSYYTKHLKWCSTGNRDHVVVPVQQFWTFSGSSNDDEKFGSFVIFRVQSRPMHCGVTEMRSSSVTIGTIILHEGVLHKGVSWSGNLYVQISLDHITMLLNWGISAGKVMTYSSRFRFRFNFI